MKYPEELYAERVKVLEAALNELLYECNKSPDRDSLLDSHGAGVAYAALAAKRGYEIRKVEQ